MVESKHEALISVASTVTGDGRHAESMGSGLKEESKRDVTSLV
jgi:hypothetical protein